MSEATLPIQCYHGVYFDVDTPSNACEECNRITLAAHVGLYGDDRPRTRIRVMVGVVGAREPDSTLELACPDYANTPERLAQIFESLARMLLATTRDISDDTL